MKPGCIEPEQWLLLEKFEEELNEPFFSAEVYLRNRKDCLLIIRGNHDGLLKASERLERCSFTCVQDSYGCIYDGECFKGKSVEYFKQRIHKDLFLIGCIYIHGGFNFNQKHNPASQYSKIRKDDEDRNDFQEEFGGHVTHVIERSDEKFFEHYLDEKNKFLKERIIKSDDCT